MPVHHAVSDIDGKTGLAIIGAIVGGQRDPAALAALRDPRCHKSVEQIAKELTGTWRDEHLFNLTQAYRTLLFLDERIAEYEEKAAGMFKDLASATGNELLPPPGAGGKPTQKDRRDGAEKQVLHGLVGFDLTAIPGIGYDTAATVISELGTDLTRFPAERHFASYIGLAPSLGKSAGSDLFVPLRLCERARFRESRLPSSGGPCKGDYRGAGRRRMTRWGSFRTT